MVTTWKKVAVAFALSSGILLTAPAAFAHHYRHSCPLYSDYPSYNRGWYGSPYNNQGWYGSPYYDRDWHSRRRYYPRYEDDGRSGRPYGRYWGQHHHHDDDD